MKTYSHSRHYGKRLTNYRVWVISLTLVSCLVMSSYGNKEKVYVSEKQNEIAFLMPVVVTPPPTIEDKIKAYFPKSWKTVIAIAHAESNMKPHAVNHNCYYKGKTVYKERVKGAISTFCKDGHESYAWSVDCGILQVNIKGTTCPDWTLDEHLKVASELSKKQGLEAWVAYKNGNYKKYLAQN